MALKKTIATPQKIEVSDAYHRVGDVTISGKNRIIFKVFSLKDDSTPPFMAADYSHEYDIQGDNPIRQAYKHLKTLPEFAGAVDC
jgi:hypothetical protein